ncbi:MAG: hypothetical protein Q4E50_04665 [Tissierellia bacterium]|nr:hypothetical protein [Tissierellia bacterium]
MKKIVIIMKDKKYSEGLFRGLKALFKGVYDIYLQDDIVFKPADKEVLYLIDFYPDVEIDFLLFADEKGQDTIFKYQKLSLISALIDDKVKGRGRFLGTTLLGLVDYDHVNSTAQVSLLAKKYSKIARTLLLTFKPYSKYDDSLNSLGLEDLILSIKLKSGISLDDLVNKGDEFDYINSCLDPFEVWKLSDEDWARFYEILRESSYNFILYQVDFSFQNPVLNILKNSDQIIFFKSNNSSENIFNKAIRDLEDRKYIKDNYTCLTFICKEDGAFELDQGQDEKIDKFIDS